MSYIIDSGTADPAMHALVIGVGKYSPNGWNLPDLGSPVPSAQAFASWLTQEFENPSSPLASVDVLLSPSPGAAAGPGMEAATLANVRAAFQRWYTRCNRNTNNLALFYFCGHGMERGFASWLMLEGFAAAPPDPALGWAPLNYDDAINVTKLVKGMERCKARRQFYVLDACQNTPPGALTVPLDFGTGFIDPDDSLRLGLPREVAGIKTGAGGAAYGAGAQVSRLTRALLTALRGAGWDDRNNPWNEWLVNTDTLVTHVDALLQYEAQKEGLLPQSARNLDGSANITLHHPPPAKCPPSIPLWVTSSGGNFAPPAALQIHRGGGLVVERQQASPQGWEPAPWLPAAPDYLVTVPGWPTGKNVKVVLRPACRVVQL